MTNLKKTNKLADELFSVIIIGVVVTLKISPHRFDILDSGALQISSLRQRDSGLYTCTARNDNGETHWAATLTIIGKRLVCNIRKLQYAAQQNFLNSDCRNLNVKDLKIV